MPLFLLGAFAPMTTNAMLAAGGGLLSGVVGTIGFQRFRTMRNKAAVVDAATAPADIESLITKRVSEEVKEAMKARRAATAG